MQTKVERQEGAMKLRQARASRTPEQQLARLDEKLGKGLGAVKERKRLADEINSRTSVQSPATSVQKPSKGKNEAATANKRKRGINSK